MLGVGVLLSSASTARLQEHEVDVFNRPVAALVSRGRPTLVLYCNRATQNVGDKATQLAVRLRDVPFTTLVHVDLRGVPSLFRGLARHTIRKHQEEGVESFQKGFLAAGAPAPVDASERLVIVADPDGGPHRAVGLPEGFHESVAVVYDPQGQEVMRGLYPRDDEKIERAIRESVQRTNPEP